MLFERKHSR